MAEKIVTEYLIDQNLGYLRFPKAMKDTFGNPKEYPNPKWKVETKGKKVKLIYEFTMEPMEDRK